MGHDEADHDHAFGHNHVRCIDAESRTYETCMQATNCPSFMTSTRSLRTVILVQWLLIMSLTVFNVLRHRLYESSSISTSATKHIFSPAEDAIHYQVQELTFQLPTPYKGSGDEVDRAWAKLYNFSKTVVSKEEASLLASKPDPLYPVNAFKSTHGHQVRAAGAHADPVYLVELDVFSQLHCLDDIRRFVHSDEYLSPPSTERISWCIDGLRQSLMCTSDINPMVYSRNMSTQEFELSDTNAYTCRDFEIVREWAKARQLDPRIGKWQGIQFDETKYW